MVVVGFFVAHWVLSVFFQSFYQHRYGAHRMFTMSRGWERFFHLATFLTQGSSYLNPRGYAILHRMHHAYSDTRRDPHSPGHHRSVLGMMWWTKQRYDDHTYDRVTPEARFDRDVPRWERLDRLGQHWGMRVGWGAAYTLFYAAFATAWWQWLLLPFQFAMGPVHGAIVNWCGHKYGYRNHGTPDASRNTLPLDIVTMGELYQNNHHRFSRSPDFGSRWFEIDPTYQVMRALSRLRIIDLGTRPQRARAVAPAAAR